MIKAQVAPFDSHENCLWLDNGIIELVVCLEQLRILRYGFPGRENVLQEGEEGHSVLLRTPKVLAPHTGLCRYEANAHGAVITAPANENGLALSLDIALTHGSSVVSVVHKVVNTGETIRVALCASTAMEEGGMAVIPQPTNDTDDGPDGIIAVWPDTNMSDPRIHWGTDHILVQQANMKPQRFGVSASDGVVAYFNMGGLFVLRFPIEEGAPYPDLGCSLVVYTTEDMTELNAQSPFTVLEKGQELTYAESFTLYDDIACPPMDEFAAAMALRGLL